MESHYEKIYFYKRRDDKKLKSSIIKNKKAISVAFVDEKTLP